MVSKKQNLKSLKEKYSGGEIKSRHAMEEFSSRSEFVFCPRGEAVYYKKSWHHASDFFTKLPDFRKEKGISFRLCPAHEMRKNGQYEGEIIIKNVPTEFRKELLNLVENMGERAMRRDVLDRVLDLEIRNKDLRITTTENQLAQKIARKIGEVFKKKIKKEIHRAKEDEVIKITLSFTGEK